VRSYLRCKEGHIFHISKAETQSGDQMVFVVCPTCKTSNVVTVPQPVIDAIEKKFGKGSLVAQLPSATFVMEHLLGYNHLNDYYYFTYAGMFHGVEPDGYIHT